MLTQARHGTCDLTWDPLEDGPAPLVSFAGEHGGLSAIMAFNGATPATSANLADTGVLARAVLVAAREAKVPRVLLASSSAVYGPGEGLSEASPLLGDSAYARAKQDLETIAAEVRDVDLEICCLRIGNVAGADALLAGEAARKRPIDQYADGTGPYRSYVGPLTLARCVGKLLAHEGALPDVINIASTPPVEMGALADAAGLTWNWTPAPKDAAEMQRITLDCARLAAIVSPEDLATTPAALVAELDQLK